MKEGDDLEDLAYEFIRKHKLDHKTKEKVLAILEDLSQK